MKNRRKTASPWTAAMAALVSCLAIPAVDVLAAPETERRWARKVAEREWRPMSQVPSPSETTANRMVIREVTGFPPDSKTTPDQERAGRDLVERCYEAARKHGWYDIEKGLADGFTNLIDERHYGNDEFTSDDRILDPDRPEFLMYYDTPGGKRLAGFMFRARSLEENGPQPAGPEMVWHYHVWQRGRCLAENLIPMNHHRPPKDCPPDTTLAHRSAEMVHVWLLDHPKGPFATEMNLDPALARELFEKRKREQGQ